jgi:Universal stress protein family
MSQKVNGFPEKILLATDGLENTTLAARAAVDLAKGGVAVAGAHLIEGRAVEAIVGQAEEIGAGLLIVGSRGMGRLGRLAMGSVSTGLAHRSPCPVLIVREGEEWPPERVLVGYGSFEDTERAGLLGASLGRALGIRVDLVGVASDGPDAEEQLSDLERPLESHADGIEEAVGLRPRVRTSVGEVARTILGICTEEEKPALLSFGSKVLGGAGA